MKRWLGNNEKFCLTRPAPWKPRTWAAAHSAHASIRHWLYWADKRANTGSEAVAVVLVRPADCMTKILRQRLPMDIGRSCGLKVVLLLISSHRHFTSGRSVERWRLKGDRIQRIDKASTSCDHDTVAENIKTRGVRMRKENSCSQLLSELFMSCSSYVWFL